MNERVRRIVEKERRRAARKRAGGLFVSERVGLGAIALILGAILLLYRPSTTPKTDQAALTPLEEQTARSIAKNTNTSLESARALMLLNRPTTSDRDRWANERRQREREEEALQRAFPN